MLVIGPALEMLAFSSDSVFDWFDRYNRQVFKIRSSEGCYAVHCR